MLTFLVLVAGVVVIGVFVWNYRRQAAAREAASAERMKAFLEQARAEAGVRPDAVAAAPTPTAVPAAAKAAPNVALSPLSGFALRAPLLDAQQRALYLLLKIGLPDHVIFACVSLGAFIRSAEHVAGFAREAQERRLADVAADFVVCDKSMKPVAAVQCGARSGKAAETAAFAAACAASVGLRWVEISPQALPRPDEIKTLLLG